MSVVWEFLMEHGRLPTVDDDPKPWTYEAWLLPYVQEIHRRHPAVPDRWGYLLKTHDLGRFPDEPIPQMDFVSEFAPECKPIQADIKRYLTFLRGHGLWAAFRLFVDFLAFGLGVSADEPEITEEEAEKLYREVNIGPWLVTPSDHLGTFLSLERGQGFNPNAFYPTPQAICDLIGSILFTEGRDRRAESVNEPCVGTGRFLLGASNYSMNLSGQDIDPLAIAITKINGALFAPWINKPPMEAIKKELENAQRSVHG